MKCVADVTLKAARDSNRIVITHGSVSVTQRNYFRKLLVDGGANENNILTVFLHCDKDSHMQSGYKRYLHFADMGFKFPSGIMDFDSWVKVYDTSFQANFDDPDES